MTNANNAAATSPQPATEGMRGEIEKKWGKFSADEVVALKDKDDLIAQVATKYGLDKTEARRDVDTFAKGRQL